jgi:hypothetical protein
MCELVHICIFFFYFVLCGFLFVFLFSFVIKIPRLESIP